MVKLFWSKLKFLEKKIKSIPLNKKIEEIDQSLLKNTKLIILNNPNNPGGFAYEKKFVKELYNICIKKNIWLLVDEAYSDFTEKTFIHQFYYHHLKKI